MKLCCILLFLSSFQATGNVYAQEKVTLNIKNGSLETVLKEIRKQVGYLYVFQDQWKEKAKKITISVHDASLEEVLAISFKDQPFTFTIIKKTIIVKEKENNQQPGLENPSPSFSDIHGRVVDENNQPIAGVTVTIKGTKKATSTDENGKFSFKTVESNILLVFSSVNVETFELKANGESDLAVKLKSKTKELGAVSVEVNTGYQKLPKERATGSFTQIDNATLNQQVGSNILNRLDGVATGVIFPKLELQNGPSNGILIRGFSTINGPKNPLIVVDNFPYDGDINNINPNDVESVSILKDAAAASIWGTRAGNGVIVITTKKGKFNQPVKVELNTNLSVNGKPNLSSLRVISSSNYIDVENKLFEQGYYNSFLNNTYSYPAVSPVVEILNDERNGITSTADATKAINTYRSSNIRDEYLKYIYGKGISQQYSLGLRGGNSNIAYYLSAGYDKKISNLNELADRFTIRSENNYTPIKHMEVSLGFQYTQSTDINGKPGYGEIKAGQWQEPYLKFVNNSESPIPIALQYQQAFSDTSGDGKLQNWKYYPLTDWKHNTTKIIQRDLLANISIRYQIIKGLDLDLKYLYERQTNENTHLEDLQSYSARNIINHFSQLDRETGNVNYIVPLGAINNIANNALVSNNIREQLNFNSSLGNSKIVAVLGNEIRQTKTTGNSASYYGYDINNLTTVNVDYANAYPDYINGTYNTIPGSFSFTGTKNRYVSYYGNAAYTYNEKYTFSLSGRRDASNLFGVNAANKWKPLWSMGLAWLVSSERFYRWDWLPNLRFKATYGVTGNSDPNRSGVTTLVLGNAGYPTNFPISRVDQFPNPDLRWEKVRIINVGFDFGSKQQKISGSIEAYYKKGIDLFGPVPIDPTTGLNDMPSITKNVASMQGNGLDITLRSQNISNAHKFKWSTDLLFSYSKNKTTSYYVDTTGRSSTFISNGFSINPVVGQPLYSIVAFHWAGLDANGNPQGYLDKSTVTTDYYSIVNLTRKEDLIYKSYLPAVFGNLLNSFNFKGITLLANVSYKLGYYFIKPSLSYSSLYNSGATVGTSDYSKRWQKPGDEKITNVPSEIYPGDYFRDIFYSNSEVLIDKADNIKLQYINLSYDLSNKLWKQIPMLRLTFYLNISNIGTIWKANKDGIDPDYVSTINPGKIYAFGVRANF